MSTPPTESFGVTDAQKDDIYDQMLQAGLKSGLGGMNQYQWCQGNLAANTVAPTVTGTPAGNICGNGESESPNDGYSIQGQGQTEAVRVLSEAAQEFGADAT